MGWDDQRVDPGTTETSNTELSMREIAGPRAILCAIPLPWFVASKLHAAMLAAEVWHRDGAGSNWRMEMKAEVVA